MSDEIYLLGLLLLVVVGIGFTGCEIGHKNGRISVQREAVSLGYATWDGGEDGKSTFRWKEAEDIKEK